ncbi:MAG TPA: UDP-N-acetylmuramoyl-L-alanyl-D-glutamate--2,6-diaminopimelate ligase, partial [Myxococcota bacterium]|nr:UDP-N-acetylmuramoyl-L-alanyl-D-glutamate--2,6-diaminopimelate ligase [Myxococcota bacterium]
LCARRLGNPGAAMAVVGITGTNGKTTTSFLLEAIGKAAGWKVGIIGTTGHFIDGRPIPSTHTTPGAPVLQALLAQMRDAGVRLVAMEVSSIGLDAYRADGIPFAAAIFTNLSRDHLDYHGSMEAYAAAKARLFTELLAGRAILNQRDPAWTQMGPADQPRWTFGTDASDLRVEGLEAGPSGSRGRFYTPIGNFDGLLQLIGHHNVENALGALGAALAVGIPLSAAAAGLAALPAVPGRLEAIPNSRGLHVLVDYAHSDDALQRVLAELRRLAPRRILTVFGCGGDRDRGKRPLMGRAATEGSDRVFVTSDNPRSEDPTAIIRDILPGLQGSSWTIEPDRAAAIHQAIAAAEPGDLVLIAGKGHETGQQIGNSIHPFDDRLIAREALQ